MALKDKRMEAGAAVDPRAAAAIASRLEDGRLPCAAAWDAADHLGVQPLTIGRTADRLQVRLSACQLGFFGPARNGDDTGAAEPAVPEAFTEALLATQREGREMSCARLWREADRFGVPRRVAGGITDRLGIKVRACDLGAF